MKISLSAEVFCTDGEGGDSVGLVLNPRRASTCGRGAAQRNGLSGFQLCRGR